MKCSILLKHKERLKLIPWIIPEKNEPFFEPYLEFLAMVVTNLKNNGSDFREAEFIQLVTCMEGLPVMWSHVEHLHTRVNIDPVELAKEQQRLEDAVVLMGQSYDKLKQNNKHHGIRTEH